MTHYVILGNSAAGLTAIDAIRQRDKTGAITLISKEPDPAYSRVALPYILSKEKNLKQITLQDDGLLRGQQRRDDHRHRRRGPRRQEQDSRLEDGRALSYDKLLIATGSASRVPPVQGIEDADVCYHWTLADTRKLEQQMAKREDLLRHRRRLHQPAHRQRAHQGRAAQVHRRRDRRPGDAAAPRQDRRRRPRTRHAREGHRRPPRRLRHVDRASQPGVAGGRVRCHSERQDPRRRHDRLRHRRPPERRLRAATPGIEIANGIVTNERQETNVADVYAAGDCAETHDFLSGERVVHAIWPTAIDQGRVAGANMAGDTRSYPGSLSWNVTELFGLTSASVGEFRDRQGLEPIVFHNAAANIYRKLLLDGNRIVGAVVIGRAEHIQDLGVVQAMIRRKTDISRWKHMLHGERINYGMLAYETIKK